MKKAVIFVVIVVVFGLGFYWASRTETKQAAIVETQVLDGLRQVPTQKATGEVVVSGKLY